MICLDGCADEYLTVSISGGRMPRLAAMARGGYRGMVRGALPSFTNVNNTSIVTGAPPVVHGICGNFFLDPATGEEVMMNSPHFRRCPTILCAAAEAGRKVAFVTAKEKLRTVLGDGLVERGGIAFSTERLAEARMDTHGIEDVAAVIGREQPAIYSGDASVCVLEAGAALLEQGRADEVAAFLREQKGITEVHERATAVAELELAEDRIGDLVVLAGREVVLGKTPAHHDLSVLEGELRSHGGRFAMPYDPRARPSGVSFEKLFSCCEGTSA